MNSYLETPMSEDTFLTHADQGNVDIVSCAAGRPVPLEMHPAGRHCVQRINLAWYSRLGDAIRPMVNLSKIDKPGVDQFFEVHTAKTYLDALADSQISHLQLRACREPLQNLLYHIDQVFKGQNWEEDLRNQKFAISHHAAILFPLLEGELSVQNAYLVWPKRAYDIELLIQDATRILSDAARQGLIPIERHDIAETGKCLAFELPTAALFHAFRAADSVLRRYYRSIIGTDPKPKMRNWGTYIKVLRSRGASEKILTALEQLRDLHRNPVIHPEAQVDIEEALSFVGITESVISAMLAEIHQQNMANTIAALGSSATALPLPPQQNDPQLDLGEGQSG